MPRKIDVDDEVYAVLERNVAGFEQPNDVLRRLLALDGAASGDPLSISPGSRRGRLQSLIDANLLDVGDELRHEQVRKGRVFTAQVREGGELETSKGTYQAPSRALADLVGTQIDGWHHWHHVLSGKTLRELREGTR